MMTVPLGDRGGRRRGLLEDQSAMAVGITISPGVLLLLLLLLVYKNECLLLV
ncbi:GSCOCG00007558001-RA-CDS [Cotesia congregata]|nr:GSCOCG00007558001-RA-CDS [Cotesia congregata]